MYSGQPALRQSAITCAWKPVEATHMPTRFQTFIRRTAAMFSFMSSAVTPRGARTPSGRSAKYSGCVAPKRFQ